MKRKNPNDVTDAEIIDMIERINKRAKRFNIKVWDKQLFEHLGITNGNNPITIEDFNKMFEDRRNYGISMLQNAASKNYIWNTNKKYKESIAKILERMGLEYDAQQVRNMTYKDFMKLEHKNKWNYVYERYSSYQEDIDVSKQSPSSVINDRLIEASNEIRSYVASVLGY